MVKPFSKDLTSFKLPCFKPLIASSLALSLWTSVAEAEVVCGGTTMPGFCVGNGSVANSSPVNVGNFIWNQNGNYSVPLYNSQPVKDMTITFGAGNSITATSANPSFSQSLGSNNNFLLIAGNGNAISMGNNGDGTLSITFSEDDSATTANHRTVQLDTGEILNNATSFKGNISVVSQNTKTSSSGVDEFIANFTKGLEGNIYVNTVSATVTVNGDLKGSVTTWQSGTNVFRITGGGITGGINTGNGSAADNSFYITNTNENAFINGDLALSTLGDLGKRDYFELRGKTATIGGKITLSKNDHAIFNFFGDATIGGLVQNSGAQNSKLEMTFNNNATFKAGLLGNGGGSVTTVVFNGINNAINGAFYTQDTGSVTLSLIKSSTLNMDLNTGTSFGGNVTLNLAQGSDLVLNNSIAGELVMQQLNVNGDGVVIDVGSYHNDTNYSNQTNFNLLKIGANTSQGLQGSPALFKLFVNADANQNSVRLAGAVVGSSATNGYAYSDRVVVLGGGTAQETENVQLIYSPTSNVENMKYSSGGTEVSGNIAVFTSVQVSSGLNTAEDKALVKLNTIDSMLGFDLVSTTLRGVDTDQYGKATNSSGNPLNNLFGQFGQAANSSTGYTTYFINNVISKGVTQANREAATAALGANYSLYLANINSLNKRMSELRNNPHSRGVWVRIFTGGLDTQFGTNVRSYYTTIQGGYDRVFNINGVNNYLGFALSYMNAISHSQAITDLDGKPKGLKQGNSNGFELAIYNAYIQDGASHNTGWKNGLYSDTVLKFSFMNNALGMIDPLESNQQYYVNNFGFTLSEEVGYRFLLGDQKEFFIDPQLELTLAYLSSGQIKQNIGINTLNGEQEGIFTFRTRIGSNFGYKFDRFTQNRNFKSQIYLGAYFVGDSISGGNVNLASYNGVTQLSNTAFLPSHLDGFSPRFVFNLGTSFLVKENHRIYFDFERSFGGVITTLYQFNLGYRYSFGKESTKITTGTTSNDNEVKEITPEAGIYIRALETQKLSRQQAKALLTLQKQDKLRVVTEGKTKAYIIGRFKSIDEAKAALKDYEGIAKELKTKLELVEVR